MWDGANGHTIQRQASVSIPVSETREAKKNMPCCQNRLWRLICCFYRTKSWEQKTGTLSHLAIDIANFLGNFYPFSASINVHYKSLL